MSTLPEQIRAIIAQDGPISFARFMELSLYCPVYGFYEKKEDTVGRHGHFYTSVSVGPLFGQLLAFQFGQWAASAMPGKARPAAPEDFAGWRLVEAGAHDGRLAHDILEWLQRFRPDWFATLEYQILEPSLRRQEWQRARLHRFGDRVKWLEQLPVRSGDLPAAAREPYTIVFSNELLDAFPVHRLGWDAPAGRWFEWGVAVQNGEFVWTRLAVGPPLGARPPAASFRPDQLPEGFITETGPAAVAWWRAAAESLRHGRVLTIDYGLEAAEFFAPHRAGGTLRSYRKHTTGADLLASPGEQDLTAHVNFTALRQAGEAAGLQTEADTSQEFFLTGIVRAIWERPDSFGPWTPEVTRQFKTLIHPQHLGRAFRVLVQKKSRPTAARDLEPCA